MADPQWRKGQYIDGPNQCGYYTAGIDAPIKSALGKPDWHLHAIEFHDKDKSVAKSRRDLVLGLLMKNSA